MAVFGFKTSQQPKPKSIALVASDPAFLKLLESYASKAAFEGVHSFPSNEALGDADPVPVVDIVVMDWEQRGNLSGLALYNRLRRLERYATTPIIVVSAHVSTEDFRLLREFPTSSLLSKPLVFASFQEEIKHLWTERLWYGSNTDLMKEIFTAIEENPREVAKELPRLVRSSPKPMPIMMLIGRMLADKGRLADAEAVFRRVVQVEETNVAALNELGKILYRVGRPREAMDILRSCKRLSPRNIERLCLMGEIDLTEGDSQAARAHFNAALLLDAADPKARAGLKLADNVEEFFAQSNRGISVTRNFASLMNTIGIFKVRAGALDEGIEQYKSAVPFLNDEIALAKIMFNLGLGYLRKKELSAAMQWFQDSLQKGGESFAKSHKYVAIVATALKKHGNATKAEAAETESQALTRSLVQGIEELGTPGPATESAASGEAAAPGEAAPAKENETVQVSATGPEGSDAADPVDTTQVDEELTPLAPPSDAA